MLLKLYTRLYKVWQKEQFDTPQVLDDGLCGSAALFCTSAMPHFWTGPRPVAKVSVAVGGRRLGRSTLGGPGRWPENREYRALYT